MRAAFVSLTFINLALLVGTLGPSGSASAQNLVAAYSFDEGSGTLAGDSSGNANTGTISNGSWTSSGRFGSALGFDGTSTMVTVLDSASLDLTTGMTLEAWVYPTAPSNWRTLLMKETDATGAYFLYASDNAPHPAVYVRTNGIEDHAPGTNPLPLNAWSHLAATYDGSALRLYVNGTQVGSTAVSGPIDTTTFPLRIGGNTVWDGEYFAGRIDEVRIYSRALSAAEIASDMNAPISAGSGDMQSPTAPSSLAATTISSSQLNLSWTASTDNVAVTGYLIERCFVAGCSLFDQIATTAGTSYSDTGLSASTSYTYRVRAIDAVGNFSSYSNTASAPTAAASGDAGLVAAYSFNEGSGTTVGDSSGRSNTGTVTNGSWTTEGRFGNALTFNGTSTIVTVPDSASLDLTTGMTLEAWVRPTQLSNWHCVLMKETSGTHVYLLYAREGEPNPAVWVRSYGLEYHLPGPSALPLSAWSHLAATYDGTTLRLYVNGTQVADGTMSGAIDTSTSPLTIGGNTVWGEYFAGRIDEVRVYSRALSAAEIASDMIAPVSDGSEDAESPTTPSNLVATAISSSQVNLSWNASTDNVAVTGYLVERCQGASCTSFSQIATPTGTMYNDTGPLPSTTYRYRVRARDAVPNYSGYSSIVNATTPAAGDTQPPTVPTNLAATPVSSTQINLSWTASTDNVGVTGYLVERCQGASCTSFSQIATPTGTTYNDTGRSPSTAYRYHVRAQDAVPNFSAYSSIVNATTPAAPDTQPPTAPTNLTATPVSSTQINLSWTASTDNVGVTGYLVERCQGASCTSFSQIATPTGTTYNDTGRSPSTTYRYRVRAQDAVPNFSSYSSIVNATTPAAADTQPPTTPTGLTVTAGANQNVLAWTASTDNVGVTAYLIERCSGAGCSNFAQIDTASATSYTDATALAGISYRYRVRARDAVPNYSGYSSIGTATPADCD